MDRVQENHEIVWEPRASNNWDTITILMEQNRETELYGKGPLSEVETFSQGIQPGHWDYEGTESG